MGGLQTFAALVPFLLATGLWIPTAGAFRHGHHRDIEWSLDLTTAKKGGVIRLLAVQPCEIQLTFQFRVFGCDSMQSFLDRLLVAVFHFLPAFSWVKHC